MYNHNKAQQSKNRVHISWDILYMIFNTQYIDDPLPSATLPPNENSFEDIVKWNENPHHTEHILVINYFWLIDWIHCVVTIHFMCPCSIYKSSFCVICRTEIISRIQMNPSIFTVLQLIEDQSSRMSILTTEVVMYHKLLWTVNSTDVFFLKSNCGVGGF